MQKAFSNTEIAGFLLAPPEEKKLMQLLVQGRGPHYISAMQDLKQNPYQETELLSAILTCWYHGGKETLGYTYSCHKQMLFALGYGRESAKVRLCALFTGIPIASDTERHWIKKDIMTLFPELLADD